MLIVGIIFFLAVAAASIRASTLYDRALAKGNPKSTLRRLENVGIVYFTLALVLGFVIVGTLETAL